MNDTRKCLHSCSPDWRGQTGLSPRDAKCLMGDVENKKTSGFLAQQGSVGPDVWTSVFDLTEPLAKICKGFQCRSSKQSVQS